ncbi:hypothetical protein [Clostridium beijerinckii]|uniref:Uncharacterized protein n=1 Tax=Clostridium beijerinckii TaxID=1520 RepID=A0A9Q5CV58_CLOBE|nr:hypothetical protein [Clostridium beijerinckii]AQS05991.1 hypothetical protein CLBIJ_34340 [Clostridium beijerinckii]MBA2888100.1 hypothetical protein [Clostridium beijerinckii]MBA2902880.1 hypothetical protein [Clostridium beijerinckii]MBA2912706.1 hypothetical protein [Clostridium beijerinckii]MBA9014406.1 hypothetical protein [Clostridium beijerinckii]
MILKHRLGKLILFTIAFGTISGITLGITKIEMPILGYVILGGTLVSILTGIHICGNKK